jgi:signal transduction histidine kinase
MKSPDLAIQLHRYQQLIEISRDLASTLDLETLLVRIVQAAVDLSDAQEASILLYDQAKNELRFEVATNISQLEMRGLSVPVDSSLAGWIVTHGKPVRIDDVGKDNRYFSYIAQVTNTPTKTLLGVPLITKNKVIGALEAINKRSGQFTEVDENFLSTLGTQAAIAIENARLFQQSDLISELVHELRTPLTSLMTAFHLLLRTDVPPVQHQRISEIVEDEIARLSDLTTSFLDLARLESGRAKFHFERFEVNRLLEDCQEIMKEDAAKKMLTIQIDAPADIPTLEADRAKIKQVIINLLSNAIKYIQPQGSIHIRAGAANDILTIQVQDDGPGIPSESLPYVFEKFYRVPGAEHTSAGTGLGLSICKRITEAHGGQIAVSSHPGEGTTFSLQFPLKP